MKKGKDFSWREHGIAKKKDAGKIMPINNKKKTDSREQMDDKLVKSLEEQFARELEEGQSAARKGYRSLFSAYFVFLLFMASVTDYLQINLMDGFFLAIMVSGSLFCSAMFGMLFAFSYYCRQGASGIVMEPIGCVTEFLPFSYEVYGKYVQQKLLLWRRRIFFVTLGIHLLGIHIFTRDNAFPHVLFEYPMDWGRYIVTVLVVVLFSWLVSYEPVMILKNWEHVRLYQGRKKPFRKAMRRSKLKGWQSTVLIGAGTGSLSYVLYCIIHYILYYALTEKEQMMMVDASYGELAVMMIICIGITKILGDFREERLTNTWKSSLIFVLLAIVSTVAADSNGTIFYEKSVVVQHVFYKTEYSFEDVGTYELYVEKKLGFVENTIFLLTMDDRKQVKLNLSRAELDEETSAFFEGTAEWGFTLSYVKKLHEAGVNGVVRNRALMEKDINSVYDEEGKKPVIECLEQICRLSRG